MKPMFVNLIAFLVVLTSMGFSSFHSTFEEDTDYLVRNYNPDSWETDNLTTPAKKCSERVTVIAQDFIPIVLISDHSQPLPRFDHYLPLHSQERSKEYFLLI